MPETAQVTYQVIDSPKREITEAANEVYRELCVRRRIYGRWVQDGKMTRQEAIDRGQRLEAALEYLLSHPDMPEGFQPQDEKPVVASPF